MRTELSYHTVQLCAVWLRCDEYCIPAGDRSSAVGRQGPVRVLLRSGAVASRLSVLFIQPWLIAVLLTLIGTVLVPRVQHPDSCLAVPRIISRYTGTRYMVIIPRHRIQCYTVLYILGPIHGSFTSVLCRSEFRFFTAKNLASPLVRNRQTLSY